MTFLGAGIMMSFAIALLVTTGINVVTAVLTVIGLVLIGVVLFDQPIASEFRKDGVVRRAPLRHHWLPWSEVTRLSRMRVGVLRTQRNGRGGGLTAEVGRRTYPLVDRMESAIEFDDLRRMFGAEQAEVLRLTDQRRPPDGRSPTWLYRRREWRPESASAR
jgi:hypothetical protein